MTISENKHSWMKIIIAIAMSFCGLLGIQMQYLNYTSTGLGKEILIIVFFCTFIIIQIILPFSFLHVSLFFELLF